MKCLVLLAILINFSFIPSFAQDWQKIVPMVSTCKNVEKILEIKGCDYPMSQYNFPKYDVVVQISDGSSQWKAPKGKVNNVIVIFREQPTLKTYLETYNTNLDGYTKTQVYDLPNSYEYKNERVGIRITVSYMDFEKEEFVQSIALSPPRKKIIKGKTSHKRFFLKQ